MEDICGWLRQQDGRVVHDILPIKTCKNEQLGCASKEELTWHFEDVFHELRGDRLIMICLRNSKEISATLSKLDYNKLTGRQIDILFEKHFTINPDSSHEPQINSVERAEAFKSGQSTSTEADYDTRPK